MVYRKWFIERALPPLVVALVLALLPVFLSAFRNDFVIHLLGGVSQKEFTSQIEQLAMLISDTVDSGTVGVIEEWKTSIEDEKKQRTVPKYINFTKQFSKEPQVVCALATLDVPTAPGSQIQIRVFPTNITKHGFTLNFNTWSGTTPEAVYAVWVAYQ
jgi:H-type lectin domain